MATKAQLFEEVKKQLVTKYELRPEDVTPQARLREDLIFDSLSLVEILIDLEHKNGILFKESVYHDIKKRNVTVQFVVDELAKKLNVSA